MLFGILGWWNTAKRRHAVFVAFAYFSAVFAKNLNINIPSLKNIKYKILPVYILYYTDSVEVFPYTSYPYLLFVNLYAIFVIVNVWIK